MAVVRINNFEAHNEEIMDQQIEDLAGKNTGSLSRRSNDVEY